MKKSIVVTKVSTLSSSGSDINELWDNIMNYKHGISPLELEPSLTNIRIAGQIKEKLYSQRFDADKDFHRLDRLQKISLMLSEGILGDEDMETNLPVILGVGMCGVDFFEKTVIQQQSGKAIMPFEFLGTLDNLASGIISTKYKLKGMNYILSSACASSSHALINASLLIESGLYEKVLVGGMDATINNIALGGFSSIRALSKSEDVNSGTIPFSDGRNGFVMSEGGAMMMLQTKESALKENKTILAELVGYGSNSDGNHITAPCSEGSYSCMKQALVNAGLNPEDISYVNAHATSTPVGDKKEAEAIFNLFGDKTPVFAPKGYLGHLLGGAGAIENALCIKSLIEQTIPANISKKSDKFDIKVLEKHLATEVNYIINNNFGFGGTNASIIWKKY